MNSPSGVDDSHRRRWPWLFVGAAVSLFFLAGWFDRSEQAVSDLGAPTRVLLVSDAGPVEIVTADTARLTRRDSWLVSRPQVEMATVDDEVVVRVTCPGRFPCRSLLRLEAPAGVELVVVATRGIVDVTSFDGRLTVFTTASDGVVMGPIAGSARVVSRDGVIRGSSLRAEELDIAVEDARVEVSFALPPDSVVVSAGEDLVALEVPDQLYRLEVETDSSTVEIGIDEATTADRQIVIRSDGPVRVVPSG